MFYDKQFATINTHKYVQNHYNEKCTNNVNTHCNLPYAVKYEVVWTLFEREG